LLSWEKRGGKESVRENGWFGYHSLVCCGSVSVRYYQIANQKRRNEFVKRIGKKENFDALKIIVFPILLPPFC
jgi:hypothetical protein